MSGYDVYGTKDEFVDPPSGRLTEVPQVAPMPKVVAGGAACTATLILVWVVGLLGVTVPIEVASAVTLLITVGAAHLKR